MITQGRLHELFIYDLDTGFFIRRVKQGKGMPGQRAGTVGHGYRQFRVDYEIIREHRAAFLYVTGSIPKEIDHIDGNRANNSWANLRECTRSQNKANVGAPSTNTSGLKGAHKCLRTGLWKSGIRFKGKPIFIGRFKTALAAHEAYVQKAKELFGEFARAA